MTHARRGLRTRCAVVRAHRHGGVLKPATSTPTVGSPPGRQYRSDTPSATATPRSRTSIPEIWITPLGSMIPATVSTAPATRSLAPRRVRTDWARRISPTIASSAPVRIHLRIRLVRTCRANLGAPYAPAGPPDEPHITRFCRCDRSLMYLAALCVPMVRRRASTAQGPRRRAFSVLCSFRSYGAKKSSQDRDGEVAQGGHDMRSGVSADL